MLIDDSSVMLDITEEILSKDVNIPLNIRKFDCAIDAKAQFSLFQPDLVITDIEMPNIDGYDIIEFIKEKSDIPILAVSGSTINKNNTDTILHVANLIGANFTLTKSDMHNKLPNIVKSILCEDGRL